MHLLPTLFLYIILASFIIVELLSFHLDIVSKFGFFLWISAFGCLLFYALTCWIEILKSANRSKNFLLFATINLFAILIFLGAPLTINSNSETTQEIGCALNHISKSSDLGFRQTCLFGYPARQFFFPTLPSIFF